MYFSLFPHERESSDLRIFTHTSNRCKRVPKRLMHWYIGRGDTVEPSCFFSAQGGQVACRMVPGPCSPEPPLGSAVQLCKQPESLWVLRTKWGLSGDCHWSAPHRAAANRLQGGLRLGLKVGRFYFEMPTAEIRFAQTLALNWSTELLVTWRVRLGAALGAVFSISAEGWTWAEPGICLAERKRKAYFKKYPSCCFLSSHFLPAPHPPSSQIFNNVESHRNLQERHQ